MPATTHLMIHYRAAYLAADGQDLMVLKTASLPGNERRRQWRRVAQHQSEMLWHDLTRRRLPPEPALPPLAH